MVVAKFPVFVLGFIAMFALSSAGVFAPKGHYQGKYFSSAEVKEEKLLKGKETRALIFAFAIAIGVVLFVG